VRERETEREEKQRGEIERVVFTVRDISDETTRHIAKVVRSWNGGRGM
jgi:hypothetical protein